MTEPNKPAAGQPKADTGPVPDRPASHPPGPQDRPVEAASAAPGEKRAASRPLGRAAESGDPDVHKALADLQTARLNLADAKGGAGRDERIAVEEQAVADAQARLGDLGYEE